MKDTFIFLDSGFLSKLNKYFGGGKYIVYDIIKFSEHLCNKQNLNCKHIFYYTAPPFQSDIPTKEEKERQNRYDSFVKKLSKNTKITIREGRCQKLISQKDYATYSQKAVDSLMVIDLMSLPIENKDINEIILIVCDSDFVPVIKKLKEYKIMVLLYTYFTKRRNTNFSRSNHLIEVVSRYALINKEDFINSKLELNSGGK